MVELILSMIALDPSERFTAEKQLQRWNTQVFPPSFSGLFYQMGACYFRPQFLYSDERISLVRRNIDAVWYSCFGKFLDDSLFIEPIHSSVFERLREDGLISVTEQLVPPLDLVFSVNEAGEKAFRPIQHDEEEEEEVKSGGSRIRRNSASALVLIWQIGMFLPTCLYPASKLVALEMLQHIGEQVGIAFDKNISFLYNRWMHIYACSTCCHSLCVGYPMKSQKCAPVPFSAS